LELNQQSQKDITFGPLPNSELMLIAGAARDATISSAQIDIEDC